MGFVERLAVIIDLRRIGASKRRATSPLTISFALLRTTYDRARPFPLIWIKLTFSKSL